MSDLSDTLEERQSTHGDWKDNARISQQLKRVFRSGPNWDRLTDSQREGLDMVATKFSRMLSGDPSFEDHTLDVLGYMTKVFDEMKENGK